MNTKDIKPTAERVLLKKVKEEKTAGGIYLVQQEQEQEPDVIEAEVMAIGPDVSRMFSVGKRVLIGKYAGAKVQDLTSEDQFIIIHTKEILAIS